MNKTIIYCFLLPLFSLTATAMEPTDTVTNIQNPQSVEVKVKGESLNVVVHGDSDGKQYTFTYSSEVEENPKDDWVIDLPFLKYRNGKIKGFGNKSKSYPRVKVRWFDNFYVGATNAVNKPAGMKGGWEIGVDNFLGLFWYTGKNAPILSVGAGCGYRSANFGNGYMLDQDGKVLVLVPKGGNIGSASSRLHLFRVTFPLMVTQYFCKGFGVRAGGILNLNAYASATTKIKQDHKTTKQKFTSLEQRFATVDVMGSIIFCHDLGIYVRWSPMTLFEKRWGPQFNVLSFGVNLFM